ILPEGLAHGGKRQRLTEKAERIERQKEFHQLCTALTLKLKTLKRLLELLQVIDCDVAFRLVQQFRVITGNLVERVAKHAFQLVRLRRHQFAIANDVLPPPWSRKLNLHLRPLHCCLSRQKITS